MRHIALLGPPALLDLCAPSAVDGLAVTRIDSPFTVESLVEEQPDAVVAFEPSADVWATLAGVGLPTLAWWEDAPPAWIAGAVASDDSRTRIVAGSSEAGGGIWRSVALPVADALFANPPAQSAVAEDRSAIAVNFDDESGPARMHRALVAIARGQLLVSEPLTPSRGLEPGIDYVEAHDLAAVRAAVENALRSPDAFRRVRVRGRHKAELFRSSHVVARLVGDLLLELDHAAAANGRTRQATRPYSSSRSAV